MSADRDTTRVIRSWLDEGVTSLPDRVLDAVLDEIPAIPQRRRSWGAQAFPRIGRAARLGLATAAILFVAILGLALFGWGPNIGGPMETPAPRPTPSPMTLSPGGRTLAAGTYVTGDSFPVRATLEVPARWESCGWGSLELGACNRSNAGVTFMIVDNVVADPCDPSQAQLVPPVGPSVDDLVAAISNLRGFEATEPVDITLDGFDGKQFDVTAPAVGFCADEISTWSNRLRTNGVSAGEVNLLRVLDVDGTRLLVAAAYQPSTTSADELAEIRRVFNSMHVAP
jgi:hypothetical protein